MILFIEFGINKRSLKVFVLVQMVMYTHQFGPRSGGLTVLVADGEIYPVWERGGALGDVWVKAELEIVTSSIFQVRIYLCDFRETDSNTDILKWMKHADNHRGQKRLFVELSNSYLFSFFWGFFCFFFIQLGTDDRNLIQMCLYKNLKRVQNGIFQYFCVTVDCNNGSNQGFCIWRYCHRQHPFVS